MRQKLRELPLSAPVALPESPVGMQAPGDLNASLRTAVRQKLDELNTSEGAVGMMPAPASPDTVARTREAMRQKVRELQTQPPGISPAAAPTPAPAWIGQTPVAQPSADVSDPVRAAVRQKLGELDSWESPAGVVPPPAAPAITIQTREALNWKMQELDRDAAAQAEQERAVAAQAKAEAIRQKEFQAAQARAQAEAAQAAERARIEQIRAEAEAARQQAAQVKAEKEAAKAAERARAQQARDEAKAAKAAESASTQPAPAEAPPAPAKKKTRATADKKSVTTEEILAPLPTPDSPLSADQQTRLAELLRQYRADEITPEEYHRQRAAILGTP